MQDFKTLIVWQKSHQLTLKIYQVTKSFPKDEMYGLTNQIRRAASSIPANIAEGCGRNGNNELRRFLEIAMGSASELEYHTLLAHDLEYLGDEPYQQLEREISEVKRMLAGFIQKLK